ncbi:interferon-inducible double-stranded RNA-dependent protein kinase activator A homolog B-like isoform X2 [Diachasmimorpha longicaudata]|uniref:interferon-inducible double-stranded RNA-dependent protein kinase activator A homolog B-like isoform X2 n=1 Tax=Diachasmimorpha longicaudata TaxID=58733 RepID=UPI0030B917E9
MSYYALIRKMQKTPTSVLQEMMVKKGVVPNYELIHDGGGSHENTFTYKVMCDGLFAEGTGRCKKDAKHTAAANMLDTIVKHQGLLSLPASPAKFPVRSPPLRPKPESYIQDPNGPFVNAIGALRDLCADNKLEEPVYNTVSDVGPPHARIFTIQCAVASFREEGISTTKKQAKHLAAKKMLQRITEVADDASKSSVILLLKRAGTLDDEVNAVTEQVKKLYNDQKGITAMKLNLGAKLSTFHSNLKTSYSECAIEFTIEKLKEFTDLFKDCRKREDSLEFEELRVQFQELLSPLNIGVYQGVISENLQLLSLDTTPEIIEICSGNEDAWKLQVQVYLKLIDHLIILFS